MEFKQWEILGWLANSDVSDEEISCDIKRGKEKLSNIRNDRVSYRGMERSGHRVTKHMLIKECQAYVSHMTRWQLYRKQSKKIN